MDADQKRGMIRQLLHTKPRRLIHPRMNLRGEDQAFLNKIEAIHERQGGVHLQDPLPGHGHLRTYSEDVRSCISAWEKKAVDGDREKGIAWGAVLHD